MTNCCLRGVDSGNTAAEKVVYYKVIISGKNTRKKNALTGAGTKIISEFPLFPYLAHLNNCHLSISLKYTSNSQLNYYFLMATLAMDSTLA